MQRVSYRTLILLLMLLGFIIVQQHTAKATSVKTDAVWLADDPNQPGEPPPERVGLAGSQTWLAADDPNDPSPSRPEMAMGSPTPSWLDDDPNQPGEPQPERV